MITSGGILSAIWALFSGRIPHEPNVAIIEREMRSRAARSARQLGLTIDGHSFERSARRVHRRAIEP